MPSVYRTKDRNGVPHPNWRIRYMDWKGERQSCVGLPSKPDTQKLAWKIQTEHDEIRKGLRPPPRECEKPRLFRDVANEYLAWGNSQGGHHGRPWSEKHRQQKTYRLKFWEQRLELKMLSDLVGSLSRVEKVLREMQISGPKGNPCVGKTLQNYAEVIGAFCDWAIDREYLSDDPLKRLQKFNVEPSWNRRAITLEEAQAILAVAPQHRRLIYMIAMNTGLRAGELRQLIVSDFQNGLILRPEITKNRKAGFQPLYQMVIDELTVSTQGKAPADRLLAVPKDTASMLYRDMEKAGVPIVTDDGKLDFHALRTSFATFVVETGANVKETQSLMRHSTPDLTMRIYARARQHPLQGVVTQVGERLFGPCQTGVKPEFKIADTFRVKPDENVTCEIRPTLPGEGSIPSRAIGRKESNIGQIDPQVGRPDGLTIERSVSIRTLPDVQQTTFGQPGWQTNGKQLPADLQRLAEVWHLLPDDVRLTIEKLAFDNGYRSDHVSRPTSIETATGFNGFSGFSNRAA